MDSFSSWIFWFFLIAVFLIPAYISISLNHIKKLLIENVREPIQNIEKTVESKLDDIEQAIIELGELKNDDDAASNK